MPNNSLTYYLLKSTTLLSDWKEFWTIPFRVEGDVKKRLAKSRKERYIGTDRAIPCGYRV